MATHLICDVCDDKIILHRFVKVKVKDGEHSHNGSTMYRTIDVCTECIVRVPDLSSPVEFQDGPGALKRNEDLE